MMIKNNFVLRQLVDTWVVLPLDEESVDFSGMLTLNDTGARLWQKMEQGADRQALVDVLTRTYEVDARQADADVDEFLDKLRQAGCLNER